jgi:polyisoprenyl-phosphate glycosyltransferase
VTRTLSSMFWWSYRTFVQPDIPPGGVDVFGCTRAFRDELLALGEANTSLVGQIFWLGHRRVAIPYQRAPRRHGRSAWSFSRKRKYLMDSVFAFSDLPIRLLIATGGVGLAAAVVLALVVGVARIAGLVEVPGYAMTMITLLFFGGLNAFGLGIVGAYTWRAYENTKHRPLAIVQRAEAFERREP